MKLAFKSAFITPGVGVRIPVPNDSHESPFGDWDDSKDALDQASHAMAVMSYRLSGQPVEAISVSVHSDVVSLVGKGFVVTWGQGTKFDLKLSDQEMFDKIEAAGLATRVLPIPFKIKAMQYGEGWKYAIKY